MPPSGRARQMYPGGRAALRGEDLLDRALDSNLFGWIVVWRASPLSNCKARRRQNPNYQYASLQFHRINTPFNYEESKRRATQASLIPNGGSVSLEFIAQTRLRRAFIRPKPTQVLAAIPSTEIVTSAPASPQATALLRISGGKPTLICSRPGVPPCGPA